MNKKRHTEIDEILKKICILTECIEALKSKYAETTQEVADNLNNAYGNLRDAAYELEMAKGEERERGHCVKCDSDSSCTCPCLTCKHDDGRDGDCCFRHHIKCDARECQDYEKEDAGNENNT